MASGGLVYSPLTIRDECGLSQALSWSLSELPVKLLAGLPLLVSHPAIPLHSLLVDCSIVFDNTLGANCSTI